MNVMSEFFSSDIWRDVQARVISTFALAITGTVAKAIPIAEIISETNNTMADLVQIFTLVSYGVSILVGVTVLVRFGFWLKDRNKRK